MPRMRSKAAFRAGCLLLAVASLWVGQSAKNPVRANDSGARVVAVGDIHGAFDSFTKLLRKLELIDEDHDWIGGESILVQTGDFLDRGPGERPLMDLLRRLPKQAEGAGGKVVVLLGNHEIMNLLGDFRYVFAEGYASFADSDSAKKQERAFRQYARHANRQARRRNEPAIESQENLKQEWLQERPEGFIERMEAFVTGDYGKWLRELPAVAKVEDSLFLHGGIHPDLSSFSPDEINRRISDELQLFDRYRRHLVRQQVILPFFTLSEIELAVQRELEFERSRPARGLSESTLEDSARAQHVRILEAILSSVNWWIRHPDGPLWFRGYATWPEGIEEQSQIDRLLEAFAVRRLVVGHTPMLEQGIQRRFSGKVYLIDTGMLSTYYRGGRASALVIENGVVREVEGDD